MQHPATPLHAAHRPATLRHGIRQTLRGIGSRRLRVAIAALLASTLTYGTVAISAEPAHALKRRSNGMRYTRAPYPGIGTAPAMEAAIAVTWPDNLERQALNVAWCESKGSAHARNGQYRGHFQIGRNEWKRFGSGDPYNPTDNAAAAYRYYAYAGSWRPWECQP